MPLGLNVLAEFVKEPCEVIQKNRESGVLTVEDIPLGDADVNDLVSFLQSLTDPCVLLRECLQPWIPESSDRDPDGLLLQAHDAYGNKL